MLQVGIDKGSREIYTETDCIRIFQVIVLSIFHV